MASRNASQKGDAKQKQVHTPMERELEKGGEMRRRAACRTSGGREVWRGSEKADIQQERVKRHFREAPKGAERGGSEEQSE